MKLVRSLFLWALLFAVLAPAGAAAAETRTYLNTDAQFPSGNGGLGGPSVRYPSTVSVAGVAGTVTKVTLTTIDLSANADLDMALVGPNGAQVMLMSDVCATKSAAHAYWTFEDAAPIFVSQLSCPATQRLSVRPTNNEPESDNLAVDGGPSGPFTNSLAAFAGISPNGDWKLFMIDDDPTGTLGFEMDGFALNLEVEPPPPAPPLIQTVTVPGPERTVTVTVPAPTPQAPTKAAKTGKRAAALAKCKTKKTAKLRAKCRAAARKLPI